MAFKHILNLVKPETSNEKCFHEVLSKSRVDELDSRNLIMHFLDENTTYPEAFSLAESAVNWIECLKESFLLFESRTKFSVDTSLDAFEKYCKSRKWSVKQRSKDLIAREDLKFRAKFELDTGKAFIVLNNASSLDQIQIINELGV